MRSTIQLRHFNQLCGAQNEASGQLPDQVLLGAAMMWNESLDRLETILVEELEGSRASEKVVDPQAMGWPLVDADANEIPSGRRVRKLSAPRVAGCASSRACLRREENARRRAAETDDKATVERHAAAFVFAFGF